MSIRDRDELISALLDAGNVRVEEITLRLKGGVEWNVGVRQMSMAVFGRLLMRLVKAQKSEDIEEILKAKMEIARECLCDANGEQLIKKPADAERMKQQAGTGWIEQVAETAMKLMESPNQRTCRLEVEPAKPAQPACGDKPAVPAKPAKVCGGALVLNAPKCPWCGGDAPSDASEVAEKNS